MQCEGRSEVRSLQPVATQTQCRQQDNRDTISRCGGYRDGELCDVRGLLYEVQLLIIDSDSDFVGSILRSRTYFVPPSARNVVIVAYSERMTN